MIRRDAISLTPFWALGGRAALRGNRSSFIRASFEQGGAMTAASSNNLESARITSRAR